MDNLPKVLVACPTYEGMSYCLEKFIEKIKSLTYRNYEILIVDNSKTEDYYNKLKLIKDLKVLRNKQKETNPREKIVNSRNKILEYAKSSSYDFILMMDQDVIPPVTIIEDLLSCNKEIVSGLYFNYFSTSGKTKLLPVAWASLTPEEFEEIKKQVKFPPAIKSHEDIRRHLTQEEIESNKVVEVIIPSAGCMLLSKEVFQTVGYELLNLKELGFQDPTVTTTDDIGFIINAHKKGFKSYVYTKVKCDHLISQKYVQDKEGNFIYEGLLKKD